VVVQSSLKIAVLFAGVSSNVCRCKWAIGWVCGSTQVLCQEKLKSI